MRKKKIANREVGPLFEALLLLTRVPVESFRDAMNPILASSSLVKDIGKWISRSGYCYVVSGVQLDPTAFSLVGCNLRYRLEFFLREAYLSRPSKLAQELVRAS